MRAPGFQMSTGSPQKWQMTFMACCTAYRLCMRPTFLQSIATCPGRANGAGQLRRDESTSPLPPNEYSSRAAPSHKICRTLQQGHAKNGREPSDTVRRLAPGQAFGPVDARPRCGESAPRGDAPVPRQGRNSRRDDATAIPNPVASASAFFPVWVNTLQTGKGKEKRPQIRSWHNRHGCSFVDDDLSEKLSSQFIALRWCQDFPRTRDIPRKAARRFPASLALASDGSAAGLSVIALRSARYFERSRSPSRQSSFQTSSVAAALASSTLHASFRLPPAGISLALCIVFAYPLTMPTTHAIGFAPSS